MAVNNKFELYKVKREIKKSGGTFNFYRPQVNEFNEVIDIEVDIESDEIVYSVNGLYYEHNAHILDSYILNQTLEDGQFRTKRYPQILCITDDISYIDSRGIRRFTPQINDYCYFSNHKCRVVGVKDFMEWGMVSTISFEAIDDGSTSSV